MHTKNSVSKKLLALALAVLMCISVVPLGIAFASENSVYMSSYDSLPAAIQALGSEGGTIYLDQDFFVDGGLEWESTRGPVTIQGVTGNETLELLDNDTLANCPIYGDITFKNLKFKGGRSLGTYGHTVTFDEGITVIGEPLVSLGSNSPSDKFVFKSGTFGRILPRMASDMVKDYEYVVDGATFAPAFEYGDYVTLGLFNSGSAMNGNLTFTMNSGSINGLLLGPNGNFNHYGVLKFVMNGGTVTNAYFGSTNANSYIQNMAIIFNKATMTDGVTLNRLSTTKFGTYVVVENNNEVDVNVEGIYGNTDYALTNTSFCDNLGYWVKVNYGKANPVYARTDEADPATTYLAGFELTPDSEGYRPTINGEPIKAGENGLYDLSAFRGENQLVEITFEGPKTPVVYAEGSGFTPSATEKGFTSLPAAIEYVNSVSAEGGTIKVYGAFNVDGGIEWAATRGPITIEGYTGAATDSIALSASSLAAYEIYGDITFQNITFSGGRDLGTWGHTVTFGEGLTIVGEPLVSLGSNSPSDKFVFKSGTFGRILPRMGADMIKDYEYVIDGATFAPAFEYGDYVTLGLYGSGSAMKGNLTFTMNSGSINGLLLGPNGNYNHYGVLKFVMNGGTVTNAYFGSTNANSYIQNMAIIFNKATMTDGFTLNRLTTTNFGTYVVVENNNEADVNVEGIYGNTDYALNNTSFCDNLGYWVKVNYGKANPVYARTDESDPATTYLAGFELTPDSEDYFPVVGEDTILVKGENGLYDLSAFRGENQLVEITFTEPETPKTPVLYSAGSGFTPSKTEKGFTSLPEAINYLNSISPEGGTIKVYGAFNVSGGIEWESTRGPITIEGYTNAATDSITLPDSGLANAQIYGDITFQNITYAGGRDLGTWGHTVTFGEGLTIVGEPLVSLGSNSPSDKFVFKSGTFGRILPRMGADMVKDYEYVIDGATFAPAVEYGDYVTLGLFGSGSAMQGNLTFTMNSGSINGLLLGPNGNFSHYGVLKFVMNGGTVTNAYFGSNDANSYIQNMAIVFNKATMTEGVTLSRLTTTKFGTYVVVENNNESNITIDGIYGYTDYALNNTSFCDNLGYWVKVNYGKANPVYARTDASDPATTYLAGFELTADTEGYVPTINEETITAGDNGLYNLSAFRGENQLVEITFAEPNVLKTPVVYAAGSDFTPSSTEKGFNSLPAAIDYLNGFTSEGGTIKVKGAFVVDGGIEWASTRGPITIEGYTNAATDSITLPDSGLASAQIYGDITFQNITYAGGRDFGTWGHTVTFGEGLTIVGEPLVSLGSNSPHDKFVFKSGTFGRILPRMASDMVKDYEYVVDGATFAPADGDYVTLGLFNSGSAMKGNLTFTMNSGSVNKLLLGPNGNFNHYGVLKFVMNGGTVTNAYFGSNNANSYIQNMAIIFNKATMTDGFTLSRLTTTNFGTYVVVENNNELDVNIEGIYGQTDYALNNTSFIDNLGYWVKVNYGKANPVYARTDASDPATTYLAGFELTPDVEGLNAYANGTKITPNGDGLYDLSSYRNSTGEVTVTFEEEGEYGVYYVKGGATGSGKSVKSPAKSVAWLINNVISKEYAAGETVTIYVMQDDSVITSDIAKANFAVWNTDNDGTPAAHAATLVIKSYADGESETNYLGYYENIGASASLYIQGPTVFEDINIVSTRHGLGDIYANGYDLTISEATNFYFLSNALSSDSWNGTFELLVPTNRHGLFSLSRNDIGGQGGKLVLNKQFVLTESNQFQADTSSYRFNFGDSSNGATFANDVSFYINTASKFNLRVGQGTAGGVNTFAKNANFIIAAKGAVIDFNATSTATTTIGGAVQIIRNSEALVSGGDALLQLKNNANGYWNLRTFNGEEAMFIDVTETAGVFSVAEGKTVLAIHQNGTIVKSEDGILDLSALQGDYDVYSSDYTTGSESYITFDKAVYIKEATTIDLATLTPALTEGKAFLGWKFTNGTLPAMGEGTVTAELAAGTVLVADYADVDVNYGGDFFIEGIQMRASTANKAQAVRFIVEMKKASADIVGGLSQVIEYGSLILPLEYNWGKDLRYDTAIFNIGFEGDIKLGKPRAVPAVNIYAESDDAIQFTVAMTGITADKFLRNYCVQGYIRYLDANGVERVLYSGYGQSSLYRTALFADADASASAEVKAEAAAIIEAVAAAGAELEATKVTTEKPACIADNDNFAAYELKDALEGLRVIEYTIDFYGSAEPTEIISFNDTHFVYTNSEDYFNADEAAISTGLSSGRSYYEKLGTPARIVKFMQYAAYANKTVVNGDVVDYVSAGTLQQAKRVIFNQDYSVTANSSVIASAGNHEYMHQLDSNENLKTLDEVLAQLQASWPNDIVFHKEIVTNDAGENAVMVLLVDNVDGIAEQTAAALDEARENNIPVIVFTHVPIVAAHQFYAPIVANSVANGGMVKAVFSAHTHGYGYTEVEGIPHFTMGSAAEGNDNPNTVLKIKVK